MDADFCAAQKRISQHYSELSAPTNRIASTLAEIERAGAAQNGVAVSLVAEIAQRVRRSATIHRAP